MMLFKPNRSSLVPSVAALILLCGAISARAVEIEHVAGAGLLTVTTSDSYANLARPADITTSDSVAHVYVSDAGNHVVYRLDPWAIADILVGDGVPGFSGDGGSSQEARVNAPRGLALDPDGNIYVADTGNRRIRFILREDATITTVAGSDRQGLSGLDGPGDVAGLQEPFALAADDKGGLYIADAAANRILYLDSDRVLRSFAGGGTTATDKDGAKPDQVALDRPVALALATDGTLYVAEERGKRVRAISASGVRTVADASSKAGIALQGPRGLALHPESEELYIADGHRVLHLSDGKLLPFTGTGEPGYAGDELELLDSPMYAPAGIVWDRFMERLLIVDEGNAMLRATEWGQLRAFTRKGLGLEREATTAKVVWPEAVAFNADGHLLFTNPGHHLVWRMEPDPEGYEDPNRVVSAMGDGSLAYKEGAAAAESGLLDPSGIAAAKDGTYYVADRDQHVVLKVGTDGKVARVAGTGAPGFGGDGGPGRDAPLREPTGLVLDGEGNLYIADTGNHRVRRLDKNGTLATLAGTGSPGSAGDGGPAVSATLNGPTALALDGQGRLYVADTGNHRIRRIGADGAISTFAGSGEEGFAGDGGKAASARLSGPLGVWADGAGVVFVSDSGNHRIRRVESDGKIETVAGTGEPGSDSLYSPLDTALNRPAGLTGDADGNLVFADRDSHRILRLTEMAKPLASVPAGPKASGNATPAPLPGDVDGNGRVNVQDVTTALQVSVGSKQATPAMLAGGDFNRDGKFDVGEAIRILRISIGLG